MSFTNEFITDAGIAGKRKTPLMPATHEPHPATAALQVAHAKECGRQACRDGDRAIPAHDLYIQALIEGRAVGETPEGQAATADILNSWQEGWTDENARMSEGIEPR